MNRAVYHVMLLGIVAAFLNSCESISHPVLRPPLSVDPDPSAPLQTAADQYRLRKVSSGMQVEIPFSYLNSNPDTVYLVNCGRIIAPALQKRAGNQWIRAWSAILPLCLSPPVVIPPNATYTDTLGVFAGDPGENIVPKFAVTEVRGVYRLILSQAVFHYDEDRPRFGDTLGVAQRVSNPFILEEP